MTPTLTGLLAERVAHQAKDVAVRSRDGASVLPWTELDVAARRVAGALLGLGVGPGDTVALLLANRPEFYVADLGALLVGAVPVSIYGTSSPEQIAHVLQDAGASAWVVEADRAEAVTAVAELVSCPPLVWVGRPPEGVSGVAWDDLLEREPVHEVHVASPDELATIIYTSGTTGPPKGVELTHRNVVTATAATGALNDLRAGDRVISWLPMAHIAERKASYYAALQFGLEVTTCPDPRAILDVLREVRPDWFFAVPRIWEKLKAAGEMMHGPPEDVRRALGLDCLKAANVGAAPCPAEVVTWVHGLGIALTEVYGMTENAACCTSTRPGRLRPGTVGEPMPGVEVRLAADGEVLMRSATVMRGYRGRPDATAEVLDAEGWLRTGDVGVLDDDGVLTIVDRKKDLIITASGKNVSPANVEAAIKASSPLIGHVCVVGEGRPYLAALVVPDPEATAGEDAATVAAEVERAVAAGNERLSRVEQVKRFALLDAAWTPGGEELTPTQKVRRSAVAARYAATIDGLYA